MCDGDGTRGGDGRCTCNHGYEGEFCLDCTDGFFSDVRNDTFSLCTGELQRSRSSLTLSFHQGVAFGFFIFVAVVVGTADRESPSVNLCVASAALSENEMIEWTVK